MEELLLNIILDNQDLIFNKKIIDRSPYVPETDNIHVFTGIRRCGKTYSLFQVTKRFPKEEVLFLDFEDERLLFLNALDNYEIILDSYKRLYPDKQPVLFFDEVQGLKNWHLFLKRLHAQGYKIYVTGSNSNLISSEIATYLSGRSIETRIHPFSFQEYLILKGESFSKRELYTKKNEILKLFEDYLYFGSFPEVIKANERDKHTVAKNIYTLLFYKDLVAKYDKKEYLLKLIVSKLCENIGKEYSISKLADKVIPLYKTSKPTVTDYANVLPLPFLIENIFMYRESFIQREMRRKTYLADNSFLWINQVSPNKAKLLENLVYAELTRRFETIYYYKTHNGLEIDFVAERENKKYVFQVSYTISDFETKERELRAIAKTAEELVCESFTVITLNETESIEYKGNKIEVIAAWRWLLDK